MILTEYEFALPTGFIDAEGTIHREGKMRLSTAADEILPLKDSRVQHNPAYLLIILLSRVVTQLGSVDVINPRVIEGLFAADLAYLQEFYNRINGNGRRSLPVSCPHCQQGFEVEIDQLGEL
jgi:hypothetical protein